jgi:hypothetical protein
MDDQQRGHHVRHLVVRLLCGLAHRHPRGHRAKLGVDVLRLLEAGAARTLGLHDLLFPPPRLHLDEHVPAIGHTDDVLARRAVCARRLPSHDGQPAPRLQKVANADLGQRGVALPRATAEPAKEALECSLAVQEPEPSLVLVRDLRRRLGVLGRDVRSLDRGRARRDVVVWAYGAAVNFRQASMAYSPIPRGWRARGCRTSSAQPTSRGSPSQPGHVVRACK